MPIINSNTAKGLVVRSLQVIVVMQTGELVQLKALALLLFFLPFICCRAAGAD